MTYVYHLLPTETTGRDQTSGHRRNTGLDTDRVSQENQVRRVFHTDLYVSTGYRCKDPVVD